MEDYTMDMFMELRDITIKINFFMLFESGLLCVFRRILI